MRQKLLQLLLNPFIIAGLISLIVISFLPDYFSKYKVDLVNQEKVSLEGIVYYADLNNDGKSEKIDALKSQSPNNYNASYMVYKSNGDFVDQFNLDNPFADRHKTIWFQDINDNGFKEIYVVTKAKDSVFLNIYEPFATNNINRTNIFIDVMSEFNDEYECRLEVSTPFEPLENRNEVVITITNGFSGNPRNVYKYDYVNNTILKSPHLTNTFIISSIFDIDLDGENEFLVQTHASANSIDSVFSKRSDYSTWLTVLDDDMEFLFNPIEFESIGGSQLIPFKSDNTKLIGLFRSRQHQKMPSKLFLLSLEGKIEKEKILPAGRYGFIDKLNDNSFAIFETSKGKLSVYNYLFEELNEIVLEPIPNLFYYDLDSDGEKEWIAFHEDRRRVSVYRSDFKHKITFNKPDHGSGRLNYGIKKLSETDNQLYFQNGAMVNLYSYSENPNYLYSYIFYLGVYGVILSLLLIVIKGQKIREAKNRAIEKQISELQLKTIKNQVDPHFVFNAINTISEMTLMDNKLEADRFISQFSGFMRDTLNNSDTISTTLEEELHYTENFIKLQQTRYSNSFSYEFIIDKEIDLKTRVPKHALFCYVENAIKHGLSNTNNGLIKILASKTKNHMLLSIEDNGGGIEISNVPKKNSMGSGLKIMDQIFELYSKLYKQKISHALIELFDEKKNKTGIRVEIKISKPKK